MMARSLLNKSAINYTFSSQQLGVLVSSQLHRRIRPGVLIYLATACCPTAVLFVGDEEGSVILMTRPLRR